MDHTRRTALLSAAALCLVLGGLFWLAVREDTPVPAAAPAAVAASTDNWGLSFQTEGEPPVGNATAQSLAQYDAYYVGDTTQKVLYLTFDCGYENGYRMTPEDLREMLNFQDFHGGILSFFMS